MKAVKLAKLPDDVLSAVLGDMDAHPASCMGCSLAHADAPPVPASVSLQACFAWNPDFTEVLWTVEDALAALERAGLA